MNRFVSLVVAVLLLGCDARPRPQTFTFSFPGGGNFVAPHYLYVEVTAAAFSPDGKHLLIGHVFRKGDSVRLPDSLQRFVLWDIGTGKLVKSWGGREGAVRFLRFMPDGKRVLIQGQGRSVSLFDLVDGKELWQVELYAEGGRAVSVSPDGSLLVSVGFEDTSYAGSVKLWSVADGKFLRKLSERSMAVSSCSISPDNKLGLTGCEGATENGGGLHVWQLSNGELLRSFKGSEGWCIAGPFLPNNRSALVMKSGERGSNELRLLVVNLLTGETERMFDARFALALSLTLDGKRVVAQTGPSTFTTWDTESGKVVRAVELHLGNDHVNQKVCCRDGKLLFTSHGPANKLQDFRNQVWNLEDGKRVLNLVYE
ncbi:MAG: hypothetical protein K2R98_10130 [Gemmataceae bacterium]|nr:hypothetical protein [Gemmataceae bacterium]